MPCECIREGSESQICDKRTGQCSCKPGVIGRTCDHCPGIWQQLTSQCNGKRINGRPVVFSNNENARLNCWMCWNLSIKGALPSLRQFLTTESPLKVMKNAF